MLRKVALFFAFLIPTQALAFDFGFVRGPVWMDQYLLILLGVSTFSFIMTLMFRPRGVPVNQMYMHFGRFNFVGRIVYGVFGLTFSALMVMVFLGMGLQRASEAGI